MSGSNSAEITINYNEITDLNQRNGIFTIYSEDGTITATSTIFQIGNSQISVNPDYVEVGSESGSVSVDVYSNDSWIAESYDPWVSVSPESGNLDGTITIDFESNNSQYPRWAFVH